MGMVVVSVCNYRKFINLLQKKSHSWFKDLILKELTISLGLKCYVSENLFLPY